MQNNLIPDINQANQMLEALAPDGAFTFKMFDDNRNKLEKDRIKSQTYHGTVTQHASQLTKLNNQGAGVFVTFNQTDKKGIGKKNIVAVRCLIADFDNTRPERLDDLLSLEVVHGVLSPNLIIESSTGKHHAYWIADGIPLDKFEQWQRKLFNFLESLYPDDDIDYSLTDISKFIRLAGFYHQKINSKKGLTGKPFLTHIVHMADRYSYEQIEQFINDLPALPMAGQVSNSKQTTDTDTSSLADFTIADPIDITPSEINHYLKFIDGESYETWLKVGMALHHQTQGEPSGLEVWNDWSQQFSNYQSYDDLEKRWQGFSSDTGQPVRASTIIHLAKQNKTFKPYKPTPDQAQDIIKQLAELDTLNYHLQRKAKAALIGIGLPALDKVVKEAKDQLEPNKVAAMMLDIEPHPNAVDGSVLAEEIYQIIDSHIVCDKSVAIAATLWIFFTWVVDASHIAPIAWVNAPEKRCGKSLMLTLLSRMSKRPLPASNISTAALFRSIEKYEPTLLLDEVDTFIKDNEEMRGVLNAGHSKDFPYFMRCQGEDNDAMPFYVYGAKAIAGIGTIPPTLMDRSISLTLRRKLANETRLRVRDLPKDTTNTISAKLARWGADNLNAVDNARPQPPNNINDRMQDNWEILLKVATVLGDDWLNKALLACSSISNIEQDEPTLNEQLLADIKGAFDGMKVDRVWSKDLVNALCIDEELRWATFNRGKPLTVRQLASRLKGYGIKSKSVRIGEDVLKGYLLSDFVDVFRRYLIE